MRGTTNIPAVAVLVKKDGKLLMMRRLHTGFQDGFLTIPSGHVERGESFTQAAVRELHEEAGLEAEPEDLRCVHVQQSFRAIDNIRIHAFFEVTRWRGEPINVESHKHSDCQWVPLAELPFDEIVDIFGRALQKILAGEKFDEVGWQEPLQQFNDTSVD